MRNPREIAKRLASEAGTVSLRFNFRGTGKSLGRHDRGRAEVGDVLAAVDTLAGLYPGLKVTLIGYSFGALVGASRPDSNIHS